jgi:hypothetical protein
MQKVDPLMRNSFKTLLAVLLAVFSFSALGEAATTHPNRHHPRHASHVAGSFATKKKATHGKRSVAKRHASRSSTSPRHTPKHA